MWQVDALASLFDSGSPEFHEMIVMVYRFEVIGAVPLGINAAVMALLYGLGKTKLNMVINLSRVFLFRIPVFWFLQNFTNFGQLTAGIVMMISNVAVTIMSIIIAIIVIRNFKKEYIY